MTSKTINLFYSYSHADEALRDELEKHLKLLQRQQVIDTWHDRKISNGMEWDKVINKHLDTADIILMLISADFLASDYCWDIEIQRALQRHEEKSAVVIPVLLRPCDTDDADFMKLQGFPKNLKPVTTWPNQDEAFTDIAKGIRATAEAIRNAQQLTQVRVSPAKPQSTESVYGFIRPEAERLLEKINNPDLTHQERERIGVRLAEIGDPRPGVGVDEKRLPQFEWCPVPKGRIKLEKNAGTFDVAALFISQYPVTFKQYQAFLEATDGYLDTRWWNGLQHVPKPGAQYRKIGNHPAETVSWYDARAFCRWLTDKRGFEIHLPTEWEWQQAATGGDPNNKYPWGKDYDTQRCNSFDSGLGRTTAVGLYPDGISPVGALDMSGNVWEWCSNSDDKPESGDVSSDARRVVRGGSWCGNRDDARAASRNHNTPDYRDNNLRFRVVCSSPII